VAAAIIMTSRRRKAMYGGLFRKVNNVRTRRSGYYLALPHGSPLVIPTKIGNMCKDTGVVTVQRADDTDWPTTLWGDVRRVRAYLRRRIYGKSGSNTSKGRSLAKNCVVKLHHPGGGVRVCGKETGRDGGGDTIRRRRPSVSAAAGKPRTESF
jgi:hypothetical protein